jgi:hypothetical protein
MHSMNQGAVFCRALILGGLMLEKGWPRSTALADDAYKAMKRVLETYVKPYGGISEGPGYLCQTLTATRWAIIAYCRARGLDWREEIKNLFGSVESYVRVMASGKPGQCIPSGDCRLEWFCGDGIPILASVFPESAFADILGECLRGGWVHEVTGTLKGSGGMLGMVYGPQVVQPSRRIAAPSLWLPNSGKLSVTRQINGHRVRLWASAAVYGATHSHLDHGAFVIEIEDSPVFVDRGMVEYWKTNLVYQMQRSYAHNVLTPILPDGSFADQAVLLAPGRPPMSDSEASILLRVPGEAVWPGKMSAYDRIFEQTGDDTGGFRIADVGKLESASRLAFHLHSPVEFVRKGNTVEAEFEGVACVVSFPWVDQLTVEKSFSDFAGRDLFHICAISAEVTDFALNTRISFGTS